MMSFDGGERGFPTTRWSFVAAAGHPLDGHEALERLLWQYMPAMRVHLLYRLGPKAQDIDDILQGFVADKIVAGNLCGHAREGRGRFRSFLLTSLDNYAATCRSRSRSSNRTSVSLDQPDVQALVGPDAEASDPFDISWAKQVITEAIDRTKSLYTVTGRPLVFELFDRRVLGPILRGEPAPTVDDLAREYGYSSPQQASNAIVNAKRAFARALREIIAEYAQQSDIDDEIHDLRRILAQPGAR